MKTRQAESVAYNSQENDLPVNLPGRGGEKEKLVKHMTDQKYTPFTHKMHYTRYGLNI